MPYAIDLDDAPFSSIHFTPVSPHTPPFAIAAQGRLPGACHRPLAGLIFRSFGTSFRIARDPPQMRCGAPCAHGRRSTAHRCFPLGFIVPPARPIPCPRFLLSRCQDHWIIRLQDPAPRVYMRHEIRGVRRRDPVPHQGEPRIPPPRLRLALGLPKGHIEEGETPSLPRAASCARKRHPRRPLRLRLLERMRYFYRKAGEQMRKVVIYFLAETAGRKSHSPTSIAATPGRRTRKLSSASRSRPPRTFSPKLTAFLRVLGPVWRPPYPKRTNSTLHRRLRFGVTL